MKRLLELYDYTISSIAKEMGISYIQAYRYVNGISEPSLRIIRLFADALNCDYGTVCKALLLTKEEINE